jgi:hypothetical protein
MFFERHRERRQLRRQYKLERRALKQSYRERLLGMWMSNGRKESNNNTAVPVNSDNTTATQYEHMYTRETTLIIPPLSLSASSSPFPSTYTSTYPSTSVPHPQQAYSHSHSHTSHGINNPIHMMTVDTSPSSPKKTATYAQLNSLTHNDSHTHTDTDNDMTHPLYPPPAYSKSLY